jgi:methylmalonyl-CoA/ethylmalonyl-CoA epimerase
MPRVIRVSHIGLATANVTETLSVFSGGMGLEVAGSEEVESDAVRVTFLPVGESRLEVLEPVGDEGPLQKFLANRGPGIHHICLEVEDLPGMLARLRDQGVELVDNEPRTGAHGSLVAFIHPKSANGVLIELVESSSLSASGGC